VVTPGGSLKGSMICGCRGGWLPTGLTTSLVLPGSLT
jgi:hypothetical protein